MNSYFHVMAGKLFSENIQRKNMEGPPGDRKMWRGDREHGGGTELEIEGG